MIFLQSCRCCAAKKPGFKNRVMGFFPFTRFLFFSNFFFYQFLFLPAVPQYTDSFPSIPTVFSILIVFPIYRLFFSILTVSRFTDSFSVHQIVRSEAFGQQFTQRVKFKMIRILCHDDLKRGLAEFRHHLPAHTAGNGIV